MSFIITLYVREGIVMASDSRLLLSTTQQQPDGTLVSVGVGQTDSINKTFLTQNRVGIAVYGAADIEGAPLAGYLESCINEQIGARDLKVRDIANVLWGYFRALPGPPDIGFHVAGYDDTHEGFRVPAVWSINIRSGQIEQINPTLQPGASWSGEGDVLARLVGPVSKPDDLGALQPLPTFELPMQFFTLQDAVDFAIYAVRTTIDTIRFQSRPKTVGGPIDVLVIKPDDAFWVKRKTLHAE